MLADAFAVEGEGVNAQKNTAAKAKQNSKVRESARAGAQVFENLLSGDSDTQKQKIELFAAMQMRQSPYPPAEEARIYDSP